MEDVYSRSTPQCTYYYQPNTTLLCTIYIIYTRQGRDILPFSFQIKRAHTNLVWKSGRIKMEWFTGPVAAAISACKRKNGILIVYVRGE